MLFPNYAFSKWILTISDDKLNRVVNSILKPVRENNATYEAMKVCLEQLTLECKVSLERLPVQLVEKYRREKEKTCRPTKTQKVIEDRKTLKSLAHETKVLKKKCKVSSLWRRRLIRLIRKNILKMSIIRKRIGSKCNSVENCDEKNDKIKIKRRMKISISKAEIRKSLYVCNKSENLLPSNVVKNEECVSLKTNMNKGINKDTGQEGVHEKEMSSLMGENNKNGVCQNSSHILKQTFKIPHKGVLPSIVKNVPEKKVPAMHPYNRQSHMELALGTTEACKRNDASIKVNKVHLDGKILNSCSSQYRGASGKKTHVDKSQDSKSSIKKSYHTVKIRTEPSKKLEGQHEKEKNVTIYNEQNKNPEHRFSDSQSINKTSLHVSKNRETTSHVQPEVENKIDKSHEHKRHHKCSDQQHKQQNNNKKQNKTNNSKTKHDSHVMSHHSSKKSKSHEQNTASHEDGKSSGHVSKSKSTTKRLHHNSSSHNAERKCKTVSSKEVNHKSSDVTKKFSGHKNVLHVRSKPCSNKTKELVKGGLTEKSNTSSNRHTTEQSSGQKSGEVANEHNNKAEENKPHVVFMPVTDKKETTGSVSYSVPLGQLNESMKIVFGSNEYNLYELDHEQNQEKLQIGGVNEETNITEDSQVKQLNESCMSVDSTDQALTNILYSGISSQLGKRQNKKRPNNTESDRCHGPVKIAKLSSNSSNTEKQYNLVTANNSSVQQVPLLPSMPLLDDDLSPCENSNLNSGCVSNVQSTVAQSDAQQKLSHDTVNIVSSHESAISNKPEEASMSVDMTVDKSLNLIKETGKRNEISHGNTEQEKVMFDVSNTAHNCNYFQDQNSSVVGKESDAGNACLSSEVIIQSSSENANSDTVDCSVQTEKENCVKQEMSASNERELENKNWFTNGTGVCSANSNMNSKKEPDVIIIDDDDDNEFKVFERSQHLIDPEFIVVNSLEEASYENGINHRLDSIEATLRQNQLYSVYNDNISLIGKISSKIYGGNEYVVIENPDFEIAGIESITGKKMAPLKIRNIIDYCKSTLREPTRIRTYNDKIVVSGKDKRFISYIIFLCHSYDYFFFNISDEVRELAEILHLKLQDIKMIKWMKRNLNKMTSNQLKMKEKEKTQEFITANKKARATVFSELFGHIVEKYKGGFRSLPLYYQALFSLIVFHRIICKLYRIDCEYVYRYFLDIRFLIEELLSNENCARCIIVPLTSKSNTDFFNDFNIVARSIRVIQSAVNCNCSGSILNGDQHVIHVSNMSSSLYHSGGTDDMNEAFSQLPSVSSSQLQVNSAMQNPRIPDRNTFEAGNNRTTGEHEVLQPYPRVSDIINKSPLLLHQLQSGVPAGSMVTGNHQNKTAFLSQPFPRSNVIPNQQSDGQHLNRQEKSTNEAANVNYNSIHHFPGNRGTLNSQNPVVNQQNSNTNLQNSVCGTQESLGQVSNCSLISTNQLLPASSVVTRPPLPPPVAPSHLRPTLPPSVDFRGLTHMTETQMSGYNPNNVVYGSMQPTNRSSGIVRQVAEHHTSPVLHTQLPNPPGLNYCSAANKSGSTSNANFLHHSSSSGFQPPISEYSNVLQGNQNVYRRLEEGINNSNYYGYSSDYYKKTQYQQRNNSQYKPSNHGAQQCEQRRPQLPQQPPVYYQNATVMAVGRHGLLPLHSNNNNNASNANASLSNHITSSFFQNGSQRFTH